MYSDLWFLWKLTRNVLDSFAHISKDQLLTQSSKQDLQKEREWELGFNHVSIVKLIFYLWRKKQPSQSETRIYCQYFRSFDVEI